MPSYRDEVVDIKQGNKHGLLLCTSRGPLNIAPCLLCWWILDAQHQSRSLAVGVFVSYGDGSWRTHRFQSVAGELSSMPCLAVSEQRHTPRDWGATVDVPMSRGAARPDLQRRHNGERRSVPGARGTCRSLRDPRPAVSLSVRSVPM